MEHQEGGGKEKREGGEVQDCVLACVCGSGKGVGSVDICYHTSLELEETLSGGRLFDDGLKLELPGWFVKVDCCYRSGSSMLGLKHAESVVC